MPLTATQLAASKSKKYLKDLPAGTLFSHGSATYAVVKDTNGVFAEGKLHIICVNSTLTAAPRTAAFPYTEELPQDFVKLNGVLAVVESE